MSKIKMPAKTKPTEQTQAALGRYFPPFMCKGLLLVDHSLVYNRPFGRGQT